MKSADQWKSSFDAIGKYLVFSINLSFFAVAIERMAAMYLLIC
jgi:hypothetical protein